MFKKLLSLLLITVLMPMTYVRSVAASTEVEKEVQFVEKVKAGIIKLGTGTEARVRIKLRDRTKLNGYISEAGEDHFVVIDAKTGVATTVTYPQVKQVRGNNLSEGVVLAIGLGALILLAFILAKRAS